MSKFVFSPSNINAHIQCPLKAYGQRSGLIKWKESPQKARGIALHSAMENALKAHSIETVGAPSDIDAMYLQGCLSRIYNLVDHHKCDLFVEKELAVTKEMQPTDFWADDAFLRCKSDVLVVKPKSFALIGDWKTGKVYEESVTQMRTTSLLVYALYKVEFVHYFLFYVDSSFTKEGCCSYQPGFQCVQDVINTMREMQQLIKNNGPFLAKKNPFCKWCDFYHTENCSDSKRW